MSPRCTFCIEMNSRMEETPRVIHLHFQHLRSVGPRVVHDSAKKKSFLKDSVV
ncbi:hypothetical protein SK128_007403, partial [Halocaridina rubra]